MGFRMLTIHQPIAGLAQLNKALSAHMLPKDVSSCGPRLGMGVNLQGDKIHKVPGPPSTHIFPTISSVSFWPGNSGGMSSP